MNKLHKNSMLYILLCNLINKKVNRKGGREREKERMESMKEGGKEHEYISYLSTFSIQEA